MTPLGFPVAVAVVAWMLPTPPAVLAHLQKWEAATRVAETLSADLTLTRTDAVLRKETKYAGSLVYRRPNLARLRLDALLPNGARANPNDFTSYIWTGQSVYEYDGLAKVVNEFRLARTDGPWGPVQLVLLGGLLKVVWQPWMVDSFVGPTARKIVARFEVKELKAGDENYVCLELTPRSAADKADLNSIVLVLFRSGPTPYLPRSVVVRKLNTRIEERWDFPNPVLNVKLSPADFDYVPPPTGWKVNKAPANPGR